MSKILAVDLGGSHMRVAVNDDGALRGRREEPTARDVGAFIEFVRGARCADLDHAVVGLPGRIDYAGGRLEYAPNLPASWLGQLTEAHLADELGLPVSLANDADLAAVGEALLGAGRSYSDVAYLTISTGIGAGVVLGGVLVHGRRSMAEVGHTVVDGAALAAGHPATVEELGSGTALERLAREAGLELNGAEVVARVRDGDAKATEVLDVVIAAAAVGAVNLAHLFTPEVLVVGGGLGLNGELILGPIRALLDRRGPSDLPRPIEVVAAELADDAGLAGAGSWRRAFRPETDRSS
ncbi:MAG: ROK family protein [Acidobacteria bacterium]|nr:ROK family protein [Acidobacteriota bacterium]